MKYFLALLLFILTTACLADIFKSTDTQGEVMYSDVPLGKQSEIVNLPATSTAHDASPKVAPSQAAPQVGGSTSPSTDPDLARKLYTAFTIQSPTDQETFQNQPIIKVEMNVQPKLQDKDTIQLYVDNVPYGQTLATTHFELTNLLRGAHQVHAELFDEKKNSLRRTAPITIYVHQASLGAANINAK